MRQKEKKALLEYVAGLTDEKLEKEYYRAAFDCLGSETEEMYELGYDIRDIEEREKYEKFLVEKARFLGCFCERRGIKLWEK